MKDFIILIDENKTVVISARNAEDARQIAKKTHSAFSATVLRRVNIPVHPYYSKCYLSLAAAKKEAFTSDRK